MSSPANICIAIVDDDESLCRSLGRLLRAAGIRSSTYLSAEAFLEDRERQHFDCLVLDIQLGGMSGIELRRRLMTAGENAPVIFITAQDDPGIRAEAEAVGCATFFRKTDSGVGVLEAIRKLAA